MSNDDVYFANLPSDEIADRLMQKVEQYDDFLSSSGLLDLWRRSADTYYKGVSNSFLQEVGEQGEFLTVFVNHYRNILRHIYVTTTGTRPAFEPQATNTDYKSRAQLSLCQGLLDYYTREKRLERHVNRTTEGAIVFGEKFTSAEWDSSAGAIQDIEQVPMGPDAVMMDRPIYEGDIRVETHSPHDVVRDVTKPTFEAQNWLIVRKPRSRWDLIAMFPDKREELLEAQEWQTDSKYEERLNPLSMETNQQDTDDIAIYVFYHNRTPAVPNGRIVTFIDNDTVLEDKTMEQAGLPKMPVYRESAGDIEGAPFGYTFAFDLLALQDIVNLLYSTIVTNQSNFGVTSIQCMAGSNVKTTKITKGLTLFEYAAPGGKLEPLVLASTPREVFDFIGMVEGLMETLSGVNSVARGNPEASLKSGAALALVQSQHLEFTKDLQQSHAEHVGDLGTGVVQLFQTRVTSPRLAAIVGKGGRRHMKELSGEDINLVQRVVVDMGNHLARTPAGRVNLAEQLLQIPGAIESPEQYLTVLTTGRLEPLTHGRQATLDLIQAENEMMLEGQSPSVLITDNHALHIQEHAVVGADTEARKDQTIMTAMTTHLLEHIRQLQSMPPELAVFLKQPAPMPMAPMPGGGPPPQGGMNLPADNPVTGEAGAVGMPQNPMPGGGEWNPQDGGSPPQ